MRAAENVKPDGPLAGLRVAEIGGIGPGPFAAMILADLGAEVVRIDRPGAEGASLINRRNRAASLACNLKDPADREMVRELVNASDVLIEGFRPGVMERLGLGPEAFRECNPGLIYARMTGWGQDGPLAQMPGHDVNYIALTGVLAAIGTRERPVPPLNLVGDYGGGSMFLVTGILAALFERSRSGLGQVVDAAMSEGSALLMTLFYARHAAGKWQMERESNDIDGGAPYYATYRCADGKHVALGALEDRFYGHLVRKFPELETEIDDRTSPRHWPELRRRLQELFLTRTRGEWQELLEQEELCFSPVLDLDEAPLHPHNQARGAFVEVDGTIQPAPAPRFSRTPNPQPHAGAGGDIAAILQRWTSRGKRQ